MTDLAALQATLAEFRDARAWGPFHTAEALARAVAVEAGELNALFLWNRRPDLHRVAEEVADVLIYGLNLCNALGFDAGQIIADKIRGNAARPVVGDGFVKP